MCAKSAKLQNKQYNTHQVLNWQYSSSKCRNLRPQNHKKWCATDVFIIFMIAYSRISHFLVNFFKMDPRNTLILAGKNGTQIFSINQVSKNNLKQKINFSKQIPRDDILAPTISKDSFVWTIYQFQKPHIKHLKQLGYNHYCVHSLKVWLISLIWQF